MQIQALNRTTGSPVSMELDDNKNLYVSNTSGQYADAALNGRLFMAANQAAVTTCTTLHNTFTGLAIVNPTGSGKLFIMREFSYALVDSSSADTNLSLVIGPAHSGFAADITVRCARWGHATSVAIADAAATIIGASGVLVKHIATIGTNATTALLTPCGVVELGGSIVVPAGYAIYTDTTLASGAVMFFGFVWEEVDE